MLVLSLLFLHCVCLVSALCLFARAQMQEFVLLGDWDTKAYGEVDASAIVEEQVFGKIEKGIWRQVGKQGHFELEEFEEKSLREGTREHDGEGPFAAQALELRRETSMAAL